MKITAETIRTMEDYNAATEYIDWIEFKAEMADDIRCWREEKALVRRMRADLEKIAKDAGLK